MIIFAYINRIKEPLICLSVRPALSLLTKLCDFSTRIHNAQRILCINILWACIKKKGLLKYSISTAPAFVTETQRKKAGSAREKACQILKKDLTFLSCYDILYRVYLNWLSEGKELWEPQRQRLNESGTTSITQTWRPPWIRNWRLNSNRIAERKACRWAA